MNDSHLLQYPICSLMSLPVRREQLLPNLAMTGVVERVQVQRKRKARPVNV